MSEVRRVLSNYSRLYTFFGFTWDECNGLIGAQSVCRDFTSNQDAFKVNANV